MEGSEHRLRGPTVIQKARGLLRVWGTGGERARSWFRKIHVCRCDSRSQWTGERLARVVATVRERGDVCHLFPVKTKSISLRVVSGSGISHLSPSAGTIQMCSDKGWPSLGAQLCISGCHTSGREGTAHGGSCGKLQNPHGRRYSERLRLSGYVFSSTSEGGRWTPQPQCSCSSFSLMGALVLLVLSTAHGGHGVGTPRAAAIDGRGTSQLTAPLVRLLWVLSTSKKAQTLPTTHPLLCPPALFSSHSCPQLRAGQEAG